MVIQKTFFIKVCDQDGSTRLATYSTDKPESGSAAYCKSAPSFSSRINGGLGECVLDLKVPFDNFDEGTSVNFMNIVKIYGVTLDDSTTPGTQTSTLIYTGFISRYEPYIAEGGDEGVRVTCLGLVSLLSRSYYKNGSNFTVSHSTQDPTVIGKAIVDHFLSIYGGSLLSYDASSVPATVGANVSYDFTDQKWLDCIQKVGELAGTGWWWTIDRNGKYTFKAKPSTATLTFTIGKDIVSLNAPKDSESVVNDLQVRRSGGTASDYSDGTSQVTYGTGSPATGKASEIISDTSITDATTADQRGNKAIADKKDAKTSVSLTVNSKFNLESIEVGQTCKIRHFRAANTFFSSNLQIVSLQYNGDTVSMELEQQNSDFGRVLEAFVSA